MKPYYQDEWVTQYCSDALKILSELEGDSVDLLATDPPYGISFMGKDWDKALPDIEVWRQCLRVLKAGGFALVMSIPRADCLSRMIISLEDAGFQVNFTPIFWAYASGFPKAQNIGKAVDKRGGVSVSWFGEWLRKWRLEKGISQKEIARLFPSKTGGMTGCVANWELGLNKPTPIEFTTICRHFNLPFESIEEAEREVVGHSLNIPIKHNSGSGILGWNKSSQNYSDDSITLPATSQAKTLDGSYGGFQPKPAVEVIIVAMKPLSEKTFVDQALKNRKGITWLDDCRIPYDETGKPSDQWYSKKGGILRKDKQEGFVPVMKQGQQWQDNPVGHFPANLLVSDDVLNDGRARKSGQLLTHHQRKGKSNLGKTFEIRDRTGEPADWGGDSGSFSRYFDLDKWWAKTFPFLIVPKASKGEKNKLVDGIESDVGHNRFDQCANCGGYILQNPDRPSACKCESPVRQHNKRRGNIHPTVKPLKLMSYLVSLGSRANDVVLDPFSGSGTTMLASKLLNRKCIGIEIGEKYCEIAAKRCSQQVFDLSKELTQ